jgi:hypothetical protein
MPQQMPVQCTQIVMSHIQLQAKVKFLQPVGQQLDFALSLKMKTVNKWPLWRPRSKCTDEVSNTYKIKLRQTEEKCLLEVKETQSKFHHTV